MATNQKVSNREKPFEYLRRMSDGTFFGEEIVKNWYVAREYVLKKLSASNRCFKPKDNGHLHVVICGDSPLMLCIARHVALYAHYLNFKEEEEDESLRNRTVISIVSTASDIKQNLEKEEYLCNLPKFCKFVDTNKNAEHENSYLDVEIHILCEDVYKEDSYTIVIEEQDVIDFFEKSKDDEDILSIDTRKAYYASASYALGAEIDNLPSEDIHSAERYARALDVFQDRILGHKAQILASPEEWAVASLCEVKEKISNIFCADSFAIRKKV